MPNREKATTSALEQALLQETSDAIVIIDSQGIIESWNPAAETLLGWTQAYAVGSPVTAILPAQETPDSTLLHSLIAGAGGAPNRRVETQARHHSGEAVPVALTAIPVESGKSHSLCVFLRDLRPQRKAEEVPHWVSALVSSSNEERAYIMKSARCLFWLTEVTVAKDGKLNWELRYFDEEAAQRLTPIRGRTGLEYIWAWHAARLPEDRERTYRQADMFVRAGRDYEQEFRMRASDGSLRWMHEDVHVETVQHGERWRLVGVCTDITEQKTREEKLRRTEKERAYVLSAARCMLWYADVTKSVGSDEVKWDSRPLDEAAAQAFLPVETAPGEHYCTARYRSRHPEDRAACDALGSRMICAGQSYTQEFRNFCPDGSLRWIREDVQVEIVIPGESWRVACVCTDITEMKEQQSALQAANDRLRRAMTETHHRVRNNLQIIAAMVDLQVMEDAPTVPISVLHRLGNQVKALASVHSLLTQQAKKDAEARSLDISQMLNELMPMLHSAARGLDITFHADHARLTVGQAAALALVVNEITTNAIKHASACIRVAFTVRGEDALLCVDDDGPGFPPNFSPEANGSTGMELVLSLVNWDLNGKACFENRPQGGARVVIHIPQYAEGIAREAESAFAGWSRGD